MNKSEKRKRIESKINILFLRANRWARFWLVVSLPLLFVSRDAQWKFMSKMVREVRVDWLEAYRELEQLEVEEGFPAPREYIGELKKLGKYLPKEFTQKAYYPYSGIDFYWGTIFDHLVLEDKNFFTGQEHHPTMWWDQEAYSLIRCKQIENIFRREGFLKKGNIIQLNKSDSFVGAASFNNERTTLVFKAGHKFSGFANEALGGNVKFGAIIVANYPTSVEVLDKLLASHGYRRVYTSPGCSFLTIFAMRPTDICLYLKT